LQEWKASDNQAADESSAVADDVDEREKESPESSDLGKITQQHVATAESISKDHLQVSSNRGMWSYVLGVSATVLVSVILVVNIWAYVRS